MKIAVYGDSFVEMRGKEYTSRLTWISQLAQNLGATHVDWFGESGSASYFSYRKILATADRYDRIIWAVTDPTRYPVRVPMSNKRLEWAGLHQIDSVDPVIRKDFESWYKMNDLGFMETAQDLMVQHVLELYPTAVLIPCFPNSFNSQYRAQSGWGNFDLASVYMLFCNHYLKKSNSSKVVDFENMLHHMPIDWHKTVSNIVFEFITRGQTPGVTFDQFPTLQYPLDTYIKIDQE